MDERFFAPCPRGLEPALTAELARIGASDIAATDGGAGFAGPLELAYRANLESRIASRILWRVGGGPYRMLNRLMILRDDGFLVPGYDWLHVLGLSRLLWAPLVTAMSPASEMGPL